MKQHSFRIGIDVGGTFTDFALMAVDTGSIVFHKTPSTPEHPEQAILRGLREMLDQFDAHGSSVRFVGHGTTVATNQLIQRNGAKTALITTNGFRDVLEIGRQTRPHLYDYRRTRPAPLVPRYLRLEVDERIGADQQVIRPLDGNEVVGLAKQLRARQVEAIAISLINAYVNPAHEQTLRRVLSEALPEIYISTSSDILPEFREYERTSTTVANAFVGPIMDRYIDALAQGLKDAGVSATPYTFHSNGGLLSPREARRFPVRTCLSGPAAGVLGVAAAAHYSGEQNLVTFDVGGTSTDVALIANGQAEVCTGRDVAGYPVHSPSLDVHVIGAGGGSVAWIDSGGALRVGPHSAGADPGPAAYAKGGNDATLTDAQVVLGRFNPKGLLDGALVLDPDRARRAIEQHIAAPLGLDVEQAAWGIVQVGVASIARAVRAVSTERGHKLDDFSLVAYGGAGPLLASSVALEAGCRKVLIPVAPGAMCARGVLVAKMSIDLVRTRPVTLSAGSWSDLNRTAKELLHEASEWFSLEDVRPQDRQVELTLDARYQGQGHEINVFLREATLDDTLVQAALPEIEQLRDEFHREHTIRYGYALDERPIEAISLRLRASTAAPASGPDQPASDQSATEEQIHSGPQATRSSYWPALGHVQTPVLRRSTIQPGWQQQGPLLIDELTSTLAVGPGEAVSCLADRTLLLTLSTADQ